MNSSELKWFRANMSAARMGLLDEKSHQRFEGLQSHPVCAGLWTVFLEECDTEGFGEDRLPEVLLQDWPRRSAALKGMQRALVRQHLERNEASRQELINRGFLDRLYTADDLQQGSSKTSPPESKARLVRVNWMMGSWAGLATTAAAVMLLVLFQMPDAPDGDKAGLYSHTLLLPAPVTRGDTEAAPQVETLEEGRRIDFLLVINWRARSACRMSLLDPQGQVLVSEDLFAPDDSGVQYIQQSFRSKQELLAGLYTVRLEYSGERGSETESRKFEVVP